MQCCWKQRGSGTVSRKGALAQNVPNPFNPETTISYELPEAADIRLIIADLSGQMVRTLVQGMHQAGRYSVVWDGRDTKGRVVASGVYLYRLEAVDRGVIETRRMVFVR
jgi:flagellar hook assembly protein FlgD